MSALQANPASTNPAAPAAADNAPFSGNHRQSTRRGHRPLRVAALVLLIASMSTADLYLTLTHLNGVGMAEANPIARWVISFNCGWVLAAFKVGLVGFTYATLLLYRRRLSTELAAWLCAGIMVWLTLQWKAYGEALPALTPAIHNLADAEHPSGPGAPGNNWVRFE
jgi:hypothetical protein